MEFREVYESLPGEDSFMTPFWRETVDIVESILLPEPEPDFFLHPVIQNLMYPISVSDIETDRVDNSWMRLPDKAPNTYRQAHHLLEVGFADRYTILEWGGGFGKMAEIVHFNAKEVSYHIVDIPIFTALQHWYLSKKLGEENVSIGLDEDALVCLHPVGDIGVLDDLEYSTFISTWALSESSLTAIDYVLSRDYYDAYEVLIAFQGDNEEFKYASRSALGLCVEEILWLPGNYYGFRLED